MRQSSFDIGKSRKPSYALASGGRHDSLDRIGAWLTALAAFVCYYPPGSATSGASLDASWMQTISYAFAAGWQWGKDIVYTYGPLGFLTPYVTWNPDTAASFRVGQLVLCGLWAVMVFGFARGIGPLRQVMVIGVFVAWYPLLAMDIGWNASFILGVVLIHRWGSLASLGRPRSSSILATIILLTLLGLVKFSDQLMWFGIAGYGVLMAWACRDSRLAVAFGIIAPLALALLWLAVGQNLASFVSYLLTSLQMSLGYGAMSVAPAPQIDALGLACLALLGVAITTLWNPLHRVEALLAMTALAVIGFLVWKAGYVRADEHVAIFFGSASFIALAAICMPTPAGRIQHATRWIAGGMIFGLGIHVTYGLMPFSWRAPSPVAALQILVNPADRSRANRQQWDAQVSSLDLPKTRSRLGRKSVDVLMNEQAIAILNGLNFKPRPAFQGYGAYTTLLTRLNEAAILDPATAPEYLLTKLQSIDSRLPTGDDPLTVLAALRSYLPVDREGGFLVMRRTGQTVAPITAPERNAWKVATLGVSLVLPTGSEPQVFFFDVQLNFLGRVRSALLREPAIHLETELDDGTRQTHRLVRKLGDAGVLVSPLLQSSDDYLQWHSRLAERRVKSMRLIADGAEADMFQSQFSYALAAVQLPRANAGSLSDALQKIQFPGFSPAPTLVEGGSSVVVNEGGKDVLFSHSPAKLTFALEPGEWMAAGEFGLLSSAYGCQVSDGIALVAERLDASGQATRLMERQINPVHEPKQRGVNAFAFGPFTVRPGDKLLLRNETGMSRDSTGSCDWMFMGPVTFERLADPAVK